MPPLLSGFGVQRDDHVGRRAQIKRIADHQRSRFERAFLPAPGGAGVVDPRRLEIGNIGRGDLSQRGEAIAPGRPPPIRPFPCGTGDRDGHRRPLDGGTIICGEERHDQDREQQQRAPYDRRQRLARPHRLAQPGDRKQHAEHRRRDQARRQRPAVETRFPQRPQQRGDEKRGVKQRAAFIAAPGEGSGNEDRDTPQKIVNRSAKRRKIGAANGHDQPNQHHQQGQNAPAHRIPHSARPPSMTISAPVM